MPDAPMRHLTISECHAFGPEGSQNEVTPIIRDGVVRAVNIYTTHASGWREARRIDHGAPVYGRLVEAANADVAAQTPGARP